MFTCSFGQWKSKKISSYKAQLGLRVTPLFKKLCEKLVLLERLYCKHQCICVHLNGLLYALIAVNAMLPQLLSVSFSFRTKRLNNFEKLSLLS